jgi:glycosyltransferase involved in cell wall biosynthesis
MRISLYTCIRDGLYLDFHAVSMLRHHLPLADEIIVHEGYSSDATYEAIRDLDPKIQVFRSKWPTTPGVCWYIGFKEPALRRCTGDWVIMLDGDEFIPEWEFDRLRGYLQSTPHHIVELDFMNFYGNYKVYHTDPGRISWPTTKCAIHRNISEIELWGDGSNVRIRGSNDRSAIAPESFALHHFGCVRNPARLRQKWNHQRRVHFVERPKDHHIPGFLFDLMPHKWNDPQFLDGLAIYEGPYIRAVREDPDEFVRDNFEMYHLLRANAERVG